MREVEWSNASPDLQWSSYFPGPSTRTTGGGKTRATQIRMLNKERNIGGSTEQEKVTGYRVKPNVGEGTRVRERRTSRRKERHMLNMGKRDSRRGWSITAGSPKRAPREPNEEGDGE
jgi:hypothetical protein